MGEATVTVTLSGGVAGEKVKTLKVTVTDAIVSLNLGENASLTVAKGTEKLDLSSLSATLVWASGKTEAADLSNAEIIGYDKDAVGESEVTVKITVDGKVYQAQLPVTVEDKNSAAPEKGCGSAMAGGLGIGAAVTLLSAVLAGKKKKED